MEEVYEGAARPQGRLVDDVEVLPPHLGLQALDEGFDSAGGDADPAGWGEEDLSEARLLTFRFRRGGCRFLEKPPLLCLFLGDDEGGFVHPYEGRRLLARVDLVSLLQDPLSCLHAFLNHLLEGFPGRRGYEAWD